MSMTREAPTGGAARPGWAQGGLRRPDEIRRWLQQRPSLDELAAAFPDEWRDAQREVAQILAQDREAAAAAITRLQKAPHRDGRGSGDSRSQHLVASDLVRRHISVALLRQVLLSRAAGVSEGRIRFNLVNGYLAQRLLFRRDLERKPVSLRWFRIVWPLVWQKRLLMPLVQPKGIYCFYSRALIRELAAVVGQRSCLEIAAGDGTLSRFLAAEGVDITATDDHSWSHSVTYGQTVVRKDAVAALRRYQPQVVVCSWPPAKNKFEREVFRTRSVELYIVIGSRHRVSAGNWDDYARQTGFDFREDPRLNRLVLPPELDAAVYLFERRENRLSTPT
ncbi:MAG: hypothetical protein ACLGHT_10975 [Acidimicrobiia bacterium]